MIISIIIPVYNVGNYVRRCLDSLLSQTFVNWECIIVDDGSTDESGRICDEYVLKDNRIRVVHKKNGGVSSARNVGIDLAKGRYLSFIDGDDYVETTFLEKMSHPMELNQYSVDLVCCRIYFDSKAGIRMQKGYKNSITLCRREAIKEMLYPTSFHGWPVNKLYKYSIIKEHNIRFDEDLAYCEDELFVLQYMLHISTCCYLPDALYHYVQNEMTVNNQIYTLRKFNVRCLDRQKADEKCFSIIKSLKDDDLGETFKARLFDSYMATSDKLLASYNGEKEIWRMLRSNTRKYYIYHLKKKKFRRNPLIEFKFLVRVISPKLYSKVFVK